MRRGIPLRLRFRRFNLRDRIRFTGRTRIHSFAGRLLTVNRVLTNVAVLAVVLATLVRIVVGLIGVRIIKPLITIVASRWLVRGKLDLQCGLCWQSKDWHRR